MGLWEGVFVVEEWCLNFFCKRIGFWCGVWVVVVVVLVVLVVVEVEGEFVEFVFFVVWGESVFVWVIVVVL